MVKQKIKHAVLDALRDIKRPFHDIWYWIRCHTINRYHMLDLRTKEYRYGWMDQDWRMFHACFNCLVEFVEKEDGLGMLKRQIGCFDELSEEEHSTENKKKHNEEATRVYEEIFKLYHWWKEDREKEYDEIHHICDGMDLSIKFKESPEHPGCRIWDTSHFFENPKWEEFSKKKEEFERKDDDNLDKLIKLRKYLWT